MTKMILSKLLLSRWTNTFAHLFFRMPHQPFEECHASLSYQRAQTTSFGPQVSCWRDPPWPQHELNDSRTRRRDEGMSWRCDEITRWGGGMMWRGMTRPGPTLMPYLFHPLVLFWLLLARPLAFCLGSFSFLLLSLLCPFTFRMGRVIFFFFAPHQRYTIAAG